MVQRTLATGTTESYIKNKPSELPSFPDTLISHTNTYAHALTIIAGRKLVGRCVPPQAPVASVFPRGATLHVPELGQVASDRFAQQRDVEVAPLGRFALVLVQLLVDATGQLRPVRVQTTLPAGGVPRKQPIFVPVRSEAVAALLLPLAGARALEVRER